MAGRIRFVFSWGLVLVVAVAIGWPAIGFAQSSAGANGGANAPSAPKPAQPAPEPPPRGASTPDTTEELGEPARTGIQFLIDGSVGWYPQKIDFGELKPDNRPASGSRPYLGIGFGLALYDGIEGWLPPFMFVLGVEIAGQENLFGPTAYTAADATTQDYAQTNLTLDLKTFEEGVGLGIILSKLELFQSSDRDLFYRGIGIPAGTSVHHALFMAGLEFPIVIDMLHIPIESKYDHDSPWGAMVKLFFTRDQFDVESPALQGKEEAITPLLGAFLKWYFAKGFTGWFELEIGATLSGGYQGFAGYGQVRVQYEHPERLGGFFQFLVTASWSVFGMDYGDNYLIDPNQSPERSGFILWISGAVRVTLRFWF